MAQTLTRSACDLRTLWLDAAHDRTTSQSRNLEGLAIRRSFVSVSYSLHKPCGVREVSTPAASRISQAQSTPARLATKERHDCGEENTLGIWDRLVLAWRILFPDRKTGSRSFGSNALVAKERLRMILISDRCSVNELAKKRIVDNIVGALADFVVIESEDKIELNVSVDPDLGAVYAVTVPVRRVKPEYQSYSKELQNEELHETTEDESEKPSQSGIPLPQPETQSLH